MLKSLDNVNIGYSVLHLEKIIKVFYHFYGQGGVILDEVSSPRVQTHKS